MEQFAAVEDYKEMLNDYFWGTIIPTEPARISVPPAVAPSREGMHTLFMANIGFDNASMQLVAASILPDLQRHALERLEAQKAAENRSIMDGERRRAMELFAEMDRIADEQRRRSILIEAYVHRVADEERKRTIEIEASVRRVADEAAVRAAQAACDTHAEMCRIDKEQAVDAIRHDAERAILEDERVARQLSLLQSMGSVLSPEEMRKQILRLLNNRPKISPITITADKDKSHVEDNPVPIVFELVEEVRSTAKMVDPWDASLSVPQHEDGPMPPPTDLIALVMRWPSTETTWNAAAVLCKVIVGIGFVSVFNVIDQLLNQQPRDTHAFEHLMQAIQHNPFGFQWRVYTRCRQYNEQTQEIEYNPVLRRDPRSAYVCIKYDEIVEIWRWPLLCASAKGNYNLSLQVYNEAREMSLSAGVILSKPIRHTVV